ADTDKARIFVGVQVSGGGVDRIELIEDLQAKDYDVVDMTDNELAKLHIRYMVGGHANAVSDEMIFRFEFPERPGALFNFLNQVAGRWNITLFHYRNHGSAFGRVLVGMQVPHGERGDVRS